LEAISFGIPVIWNKNNETLYGPHLSLSNSISVDFAEINEVIKAIKKIRSNYSFYSFEAFKTVDSNYFESSSINHYNKTIFKE
jgi:hypothetical protein